MTSHRCPIFTTGCLLTLLAVSCAQADQLTIERLFQAPDLSGSSLRAAKISPDGKRVAYLRGKDTNKDQLDLWAYDIAGKKHVLLVDSAQLMPEPQGLSAEEEQRRERQRISALSGIVEYEFSRDARYLLVPLGGDLFVYDLKADPGKAVHRLTQTESYETDAHFSPRGRYVSFIRDRNLYIHDLHSGNERALTSEGGGTLSCGMAEFIAQEEMDRDTGYWWAPDDSAVAYTRVDESTVEEVERLEIYADNVKVVKQRYPFTGGRNADVQLFVTPVTDGTAVKIDLGADPDIYLARVDWFSDSRALAVQRQSRDQKTLDLLRADPTTGAARILLTERSDTWVPLHHELTFLRNSPRFIWASWRSGFKHLYLYGPDGKLVRQLTDGPWMVVGDGGGRAIRGVDERRGRVYFMANAQTPLERHLYVSALDKTETAPQRITSEGGWHSVAMAQDGGVFLDTFSTPEHPPSVTLRSVDGVALNIMVPNELKAGHPYLPYLSTHLQPQFGTLQAGDGQTLHYMLITPRGMVRDQRYPVLIDVYGGPSAQRVRRAWSSGFHQILAQNGYVVFTLDGRGSGQRGVQFESALYRKMGSVEVRDQVLGAKFLASLPYVDPKRIGIYGWSYGGYMSLMCLMQAPETFAAAVSGAPVTDWRLYDTHYTERYMSTPQDNPEGYAAGNVMTYADKLSGPLLIMHGMADDNVLFTHSTALFKKLQDLNKPFDVMPYPGSKHALMRHSGTGPHGYATILRFFDERLK